MDLVGTAAAVAQVGDVSVRGLGYLVRAVPPDGRRRYSDRGQREAAYLRFQVSVSRVTACLMFGDVLEEAAPSPLLQFTYSSTLVREAGVFRDAAVEFLSALHELRLVGNPGPRSIGEHLACLVAEAVDRRPTGRKRQAQARQFQNCLGAIGEYNKRFTLAARQDVGRGVGWWTRLRWWKRQEEWPGGWPVPEPAVLIDAVLPTSPDRSVGYG